MQGKFGVHALVFGDAWTETTAKATCQAAAEIGYDLVEVLMFDPWTLDLAATRKGLDGSGIGLRLGMALGPETDISSDDPAVAARGEAAVVRALEIAVELGAPAVSGITYAAFNSYSAPQTAAQRARVVASLAKLDRRAGELGVKLGLEAVNRYESYMVNTLARSELNVARYYHKRGAYVAAISRAQTTVQEYRDVPAVEEALFIMVQSYDKLGLTQLRDDTKRVLETTYPNTAFLYPERAATKKSWWKFWK